jgi:hypothetical protein
VPVSVDRDRNPKNYVLFLSLKAPHLSLNTAFTPPSIQKSFPQSWRVQ